MEAIEAYKCKICGEIHNQKRNAYECEFKHAQLDYANCLLDDGFTLGYINRVCGFRWSLTTEQEEVTTDNCFIISHWQCCEKPAYRVIGITNNSYIRLWGRGGWQGYYGDEIRPEKLTKAYPKEELFIDAR